MTSYPILDTIKLTIGITLFTGTIMSLIRNIKEYRNYTTDMKKLAHTRIDGQRILYDTRLRFAYIVALMAIVLLFAFTLGAQAVLKIGSETFFADVYTPVLYNTLVIINCISIICGTTMIAVIIYKHSKFE